jgi:hypothetical protein
MSTKSKTPAVTPEIVAEIAAAPRVITRFIYEVTVESGSTCFDRMESFIETSTDGVIERETTSLVKSVSKGVADAMPVTWAKEQKEATQNLVASVYPVVTRTAKSESGPSRTVKAPKASE